MSLAVRPLAVRPLKVSSWPPPPLEDHLPDSGLTSRLALAEDIGPTVQDADRALRAPRGVGQWGRVLHAAWSSMFSAARRRIPTLANVCCQCVVGWRPCRHRLLPGKT